MRKKIERNTGQVCKCFGHKHFPSSPLPGGGKRRGDFSGRIQPNFVHYFTVKITKRHQILNVFDLLQSFLEFKKQLQMGAEGRIHCN